MKCRGNNVFEQKEDGGWAEGFESASDIGLKLEHSTLVGYSSLLHRGAVGGMKRTREGTLGQAAQGLQLVCSDRTIPEAVK